MVNNMHNILVQGVLTVGHFSAPLDHDLNLDPLSNCHILAHIHFQCEHVHLQSHSNIIRGTFSAKKMTIPNISFQIKNWPKTDRTVFQLPNFQKAISRKQLDRF